jgi:hypothetical protein
MATLTLDESPALSALQLKRLPALRRVQIEESAAEVVLTGTVGSFYQKQLAQEAVLPLLQGRKLHNRVAVVRG